MDETRDERQERIVEEWSRTYKGTLAAATSFGKGHCIIKAIRRVLVNPDAKVIIVVPTTALKNQFKARILFEQLSKFNIEVQVINTTIKSYHECDLLIVDEVHRVGADTFSKIFSCIKYNKILCVTATLERQDGKHEIIQKYAPVFHTVSLQECVQNGWIADFKIYNLSVELTPAEKAEYDRLTKLHNSCFTVFQWNFDLAFKCMSTKGAEEYAKQLDWEPKRVVATAVQWRKAMMGRNDIVYNAANKQKIALELFKKYPNEKFLTFCKSTDFADNLVKQHPNSLSYHSKFTSKVRDSILKQYLSTNIQVLNSVAALNEGIDFPGVDNGIIFSSTQVTRQSIQQIGRLLLPGKVAKVFYFYVKGTVEETRLKKAQLGIPNVNWINNINEI